jgi:hypothetical protein
MVGNFQIQLNSIIKKVKKKNEKIKNLKIALASVSSFSSCSNDDPIAVNEEEVITTVTTTLTAGQTVTMTQGTLDGDQTFQ